MGPVHKKLRTGRKLASKRTERSHATNGAPGLARNVRTLLGVLSLVLHTVEMPWQPASSGDVTAHEAPRGEAAGVPPGFHRRFGRLVQT